MEDGGRNGIQTGTLDGSEKKMPVGSGRDPDGKGNGIKPEKPIKNIPGKDEQWKAPVKYWIRDMYEERQRKAEEKAKRKL